MLDLSVVKKNKISLADYNYQRDIENRLVMANLRSTELSVLEEILYCPLTIQISHLTDTLGIDEEDLLPILEKLSKTALFSIQEDKLIVDKEMRKYFESQVIKFSEDFKPGMEFLQTLLKKVPIHVLPIWYSTPRTSDNIFDSIIEKYLLTPQIFQRYLMELGFIDPLFTQIIDDVLQAPCHMRTAQELMKKHSLGREQFEELMLLLEFHLVLCLRYQKKGEEWEEIVTPFHEWHEYLTFLSNSEITPIPSSEKIARTRPEDFAFVEDMSALLRSAKKQPLNVVEKEGRYLLKKKSPTFPNSYQHQLIAKLLLLKFADIVDGRLYALEAASSWLDLRIDSRAIALYRHTLNHILLSDVPSHLCTERAVREAEKSVLRALDLGWVYFDEFLKGVLVSFGEESSIVLKKVGKGWKYALPNYSSDEVALIHATLFEWLFEAGVLATGSCSGRECFKVTAFGQNLFAR